MKDGVIFPQTECLGIGVGWNAVEFEALNETFENRGRRSAEQIAVLRALWTQPVVDFRGEFHRISHAGLNPMPVQRPIPIWFGVGSRDHPVPPEAPTKPAAIPLNSRWKAASGSPAKAPTDGRSRWKRGRRSARPSSSPSRGARASGFRTDISTCCADSKRR